MKSVRGKITLAGMFLASVCLFYSSKSEAAYLDEARGQDNAPKLHHRPRHEAEEEGNNSNLFDMIFNSKPIKRLLFGEDPDEKEEKIDEQGDIERAISGGEKNVPAQPSEEEMEKEKQAEEERLLGAPIGPYKPKPKMEIVGDISGEWVFHYQPVGPWGDPPNPMIKLIGESTKNALEIMLIQQMSDFRRKVPYRARDYFSVKISSKYFACDRTPIKLWFDHGKWFDSDEYIETGQTICHEEYEGGETEQEEDPEKEVIGQSSPKDFEQSRKLAKLINNYHPIAISQGTKALLINYGDSSPLYRFARANDPLTNQGYFDSKKLYFRTKEREGNYETSRRRARGG
ncbi:hypothetical protein FAI41_04545 [Acetobacteraceae bacterium]|nr:hypothetical protein FAI41_04545 [Acetobacteraceae bacterium]